MVCDRRGNRCRCSRRGRRRFAACSRQRTSAASQLPDGLVITPGPRRPALLDSYADHRMVHAAAVLGLAVEGVEVRDPGAVTKTLPDFVERWNAMLGVER